MTSSGTQPGYEDAPAFPAGDAPDTSGDLEELAQYVVKRGNLVKGSTSEMNAFPATEGVWWSNTTDGGLYRYTSSTWVLLVPAYAVSSGTVATGWSTPSQNTLIRKNGWVFCTFNAIRSSNGAAGAVCITVPAGFRSIANVYTQGWGLLGGTNPMRVTYDVSTHQIKIDQAMSTGHSLAVSLSWPVAH